MQDSPCDSDMDCTWRKFKSSYECWENFSQFSFFSNFGMFFEHFPLQFRDIIFFFRKFSKIQIFKILNCKQFIYKRDCSTSPSGGNQVDGSPPAPSTGAYAFWAHMPSSKSITWQSNGSDFSKSEHYYCETWILPKVTHGLESSSLILSLWEAVVSDFDRRVFLKKWNFDFWDIFWNFQKL